MDDPSHPLSGSQPDLGPKAPSPTSGPQGAARTLAGLRRELPASTRDSDERTLLELRRKVQSGELLSASTERLLWKMKFNGHLTVLVQHGRVVKSGYEEGYFRRNDDLRGVLFDS